MGNCTSQQQQSKHGRKTASSTMTTSLSCSEQDVYRNELPLDKKPKSKEVNKEDISLRIQEIRSSMSSTNTQDFHLRKMESELKDAEKKAKDGNRSLMEFYIENANKSMSEANASKENVSARIDAIRCSLSPDSERNYHLREMEYDLKNAKRKAKEGNQDMMEHYIRNANEHSKKAESISHNAWRPLPKVIRTSYSNLATHIHCIRSQQIQKESPQSK